MRRRCCSKARIGNTHTKRRINNTTELMQHACHSNIATEVARRPTCSHHNSADFFYFHQRRDGGETAHHMFEHRERVLFTQCAILLLPLRKHHRNRACHACTFITMPHHLLRVTARSAHVGCTRGDHVPVPTWCVMMHAYGNAIPWWMMTTQHRERTDQHDPR